MSSEASPAELPSVISATTESTLTESPPLTNTPSENTELPQSNTILSHNLSTASLSTTSPTNESLVTVVHQASAPLLESRPAAPLSTESLSTSSTPNDSTPATHIPTDTPAESPPTYESVLQPLRDRYARRVHAYRNHSVLQIVIQHLLLSQDIQREVFASRQCVLTISHRIDLMNHGIQEHHRFIEDAIDAYQLVQETIDSVGRTGDLVMEMDERAQDTNRVVRDIHKVILDMMRVVQMTHRDSQTALPGLKRSIAIIAGLSFMLGCLSSQRIIRGLSGSWHVLSRLLTGGINSLFSYINWCGLMR